MSEPIDSGNLEENYNEEEVVDGSEKVNNDQVVLDGIRQEADFTEERAKAQRAQITKQVQIVLDKGFGAENYEKAIQGLDAARNEIGSNLQELLEKDTLSKDDMKSFNEAMKNVLKEGGLENVMRHVEVKSEELRRMKDLLERNPAALESVIDRFIDKQAERGIALFEKNKGGIRGRLKRAIMEYFKESWKEIAGAGGTLAVAAIILAITLSGQQDPGCKQLTLSADTLDDSTTFTMSNATNQKTGEDISGKVPMTLCSCVKYNSKADSSLSSLNAAPCSSTVDYLHFEPVPGAALPLGLYDLEFFISELQIEVGGSIDPNTYVIVAIIAVGVIIILVVSGLLYKYYVYSEDEQTLSDIRGNVDNGGQQG